MCLHKTKLSVLLTFTLTSTNVSRVSLKREIISHINRIIFQSALFSTFAFFLISIKSNELAAFFNFRFLSNFDNNRPFYVKPFIHKKQ